jgi:hypothetical protein
LADKVIEMFDKEEHKEFHEKIIKIIHREYLNGAVVGGSICPVIGNIFGIIIGFICQNAFSTNIRTSRKRFFGAFWVSFIINTIFEAILVIIWLPFLQPK